MASIRCNVLIAGAIPVVSEATFHDLLGTLGL